MSASVSGVGRSDTVHQKSSNVFARRHKAVEGGTAQLYRSNEVSGFFA